MDYYVNIINIMVLTEAEQSGERLYFMYGRITMD